MTKNKYTKSMALFLRCLKSSVISHKSRGGQVMVLSVMMIGGAVLSATAAVGILMIYEIRHAASAIDSAKALFAADAGIECALMQSKDEIDRGCGDGQTSSLSNGATFVINDIVDSCVIGKRSTGESNNVARAIETYFDKPCP